MSFTFHFEKGVPTWTRNFVQSVCRKMESITDIRHDVLVYVVPSTAVTFNNTGCGFGCFTHRVKGKPAIILAGRRLPEIPVAEWVDHLTDTIIHEIVHYEQFRDEKPITERGVAVRIKNLIRIANQ